MADANSLRVLSIFETCSRLEMNTELTCLAAHIYHRFFKLEQIYRNVHLFELYTVALASVKLALDFYEKPFNFEDTCLAMLDLIHGPRQFVGPETLSKLEHSVNLMTRVMAINLDFQINHKDTSMITPGLLHRRYRENQDEGASRAKVVISLSDEESSSSSSDDDDDCALTQADILLAKNDRYQISSHRYLVHYLKAVEQLVKPEMRQLYINLCNLAWTFLSDFHWTPSVTGILPDHLACASFMMAIEVYRPDLENSRNQIKQALWKVVNKKWNLIFCEDFKDQLLERATDTIIEQYHEYERLVQHECNTYVIDPLNR